MDESAGTSEPTDLAALVTEVVDGFKLRAEQKAVSLSLINEIQTAVMRINPQLVVMALHNLIDNAIKYVHRESPQVVVRLSEDSDQVSISVSDNGRPIEPQYREKIFEKFYRIPTGDVHDVKGHGLGLYIVFQLVKILGGRILLNAKEDGNTFTINIPKK